MQSILHLAVVLSFIYVVNGVVLKSTMNNNYPQIAVLGCNSSKANLYYDTDKHVWVEHLISSCVNDEQSILEFCKQAYPSFRIGNIVRTDTVLRFENWCELISPIDKNGDNIHRCKQGSGTEEFVQPYRCLYLTSKREEITLPTVDCTMNSIIGTDQCLRAEQWRQLASVECENKNMNLSTSVMTLDWCGLSAFRGIEFVCCPTKKSNDNDYETSLDEQDDNDLLEDDPIQDGQQSSNQRIIAMTLASREPSWMEDYRRWNTDSAYFADDEDTNDDQTATEERERFAKDKESFKQKYKEQIDELKTRWQNQQKKVQFLVNGNVSAAREQIDIDFRREYESLKQAASQERTRLNELHEIHLDNMLNTAKAEANKKLINAWNNLPLKTEDIQEALYNYLQLLLRDRIHLVNRYERLRAVDQQQAERKRVSIHDRLRYIVDRINEALNQLRRYPNLQSKIQPRVDTLFSEYDEVNQAADKLLTDYAATSTTTVATTKKIRLLPFGRDEKKIYPFSMSSTTTTTNSYDTDNDNEYDYASNDDYDVEDEGDDKTSTSTITTTEPEPINYDQVEPSESDWDNSNDESEATFDIKIDDQNQQAFINENDIRPIVPIQRTPKNIYVTYLPYVFGCLLVVSVSIGLFLFRFIRQNRSYGHKYEKNYVFTEVDSCSPEEKALHNLQMNGYENPTYRFFENQTPKC
ncbi:unnamed protein product [Adineta ricciae]|uniref:Uncharacterized protein n=1 Tax=Adineta ricciae TaxID=249248 RepID=A0A814KC32_ADIRI|nr:unnamed protein product [Adineta ricciae]